MQDLCKEAEKRPDFMEVIVPTILYYAMLYYTIYYTILQVLGFLSIFNPLPEDGHLFAARKLHFEGFVRVFWGRGLGEEAPQTDRIRARYTLNSEAYTRNTKPQALNPKTH